MFIERENEFQELRALLDEKTPQLALLCGRRRVGKTHLLLHAWPPERKFHWTAAAITPAQNREALIRDLATWSNQPLNPVEFPTWRLVFRLLLEMQAPQPLVIVLDEFQYLGEDAKELAAVASELNAAWEQPRPSRPLVLVISGSAVRMLEGLDSGGAPLHGRFAWKCQLAPFNYWHASQMASFRPTRDRALAYGIFGGTPLYLDKIKPTNPLADNVKKLRLSKRGEVRSLVETAILQEQGLRDITKHQAILRAIGAGHTEINQIAQKASLPNDTGLREKIDRLVDLGYVSAMRNHGVPANTPLRYRIEDPAFAFYYEFVSPNFAALEINKVDFVWRDAIAPRLNTYMGHIFESIAEQAYFRLQSRHRLPVVREWTRWEGKDRDAQPLEIDITAPLIDGRVLTGAIKWNAHPLEPHWHLHHLQALDRLSRSGVKWAHEAKLPESPLLYVAAGGFTKEFLAMAQSSHTDVYCWTLADIFKAPARRR